MNYYLVSPLEAGGAAEFGFTYASAEKLATGQLVQVPFGRRASLGIVMAKTDKPAFATKPVSQTFELVLPTHLTNLAEWLHHYYWASPQAVWQTLLPTGITKTRRKAGASAERFKLAKRELELTAEQTAALRAIRASKLPQLVHGVTGSGKTQIYLELAAEAVAAAKSVIVLVPEIALAPQLIAQFEANFGEIVIAQHSKLTEAQRHHAWQAALLADGPRVVIGPRSALFLPLANIGLIVIDEAHETSYKQEQNPRYQATAAAGKLAQLTGARLIMGTATPTVEQLYLTRRQRLGYVRLKERANRQELPQTLTVDLRQKVPGTGNQFISPTLVKAVTQTLSEGRQSLLFINRRGSASSQICGNCGVVTLCPNCELPLTFHADDMQLICHYCNFRKTPGAVCAACGQAQLRYLGGGTKRIEAEIGRLLPTARLARVDKDSATPAYLQSVYRGLHERTIDILIGTQMVAKGLDLPNLDLVGIVSADTMLHIPDYTAAERTFGLISQVSGRAGRGDRGGQVIIQTYTPEHPAIVAAAHHDYDRFAEAELASRQLMDYPPFVYLLKLSCSLSTQAKAQAKAGELAQTLRKLPGVSVLGPAPAFAERSAGKYQWQIIVKSRTRANLLAAAQNAPSGWTVDLDPVNLL